MISLDAKRCLITGGSRGLGRSLCEKFAELGARVAFTYAHDDEDAEIVRSTVGNARAFKGSVADAAHVREVVRTLAQDWGGIDVLVNNAGYGYFATQEEAEEDDWDEVMNVNVKGPYLFSRAVLRHMIKARSGHILNIGNFASERVIEAPIHYAAS